MKSEARIIVNCRNYFRDELQVVLGRAGFSWWGAWGPAHLASLSGRLESTGIAKLNND